MTTDSPSPVFALDIGTRSVVGLLLHQHKQKYEVIDIEMMEHEERSMMDGQIHHVLAVSKVISEVKERLENKHGPLKSVCVAAAGRSLKTKRAHVEIDISRKGNVDEQDILHLELSAVQQAQYDLAQEFQDEKSINYYCVGYSVLTYQLDGETIGSLIDQAGKTAAVEVIATFLPKVVVESLLAALTRANLELEALTLEPIAAINVLIPPSMRRLNVALVDIGAGTSDIAITDENTVTAYGMVPIAGDEVTEAISDEFLLDFPDAEQVKRQLATKEEVVLTDILGFETTYKRDDVLRPINETIEKLAKAITDEILSLNKRTPKAVMLVGGGSMTPNLAKSIARLLQLPDNRVAIRGIDAIKSLTLSDSIHPGPELVTPIGIAIASKEHPIEYISVDVNENPLRLFDVKQLTIGDALLAAGIEVSKLYGKPGMAMVVTIDERLITVPGEHGKPPQLEKNGSPARLDEPIEANDQIRVYKGEDGRDAEATIADLIGECPQMSFSLNGEPVQIAAEIRKNGQTVSSETSLSDRDEVTIHMPKTIADLFTYQKRTSELERLQPLSIVLNNKTVHFSNHTAEIIRNGATASLESLIRNGDTLEVRPSQQSALTVKDLCERENIELHSSITVFFNGNPITLTKETVEMKRGETVLEEQSTLVNGDVLTLSSIEHEPFIFQDVFREIEIDLTHQPHQKVVITKNGDDTDFSAPIQTGDKLEVRFVSTVREDG
ncbi:cell division protein FtsA [Desertibacillus haloalkaliphilus]|uniref:cell division protein FtsA n=1 Tax=Desertibacillus haloalkaliphilus TaxID=1328930 RepID=UPI001C25737E|nr:cell division protein FtsA [Desertibacillus haloalkaliphilus]MBU8905218.1 cell division protein FtsA [Desertibacillus haloalkaliphilus]